MRMAEQEDNQSAAELAEATDGTNEPASINRLRLRQAQPTSGRVTEHENNQSAAELAEATDGTNEPASINPTPASAGSAYVWTGD